MRIRTYYNRIDRVVYTFDGNDIENALKDKAGIRYESGKRTEFDLDFDEDGKVTATITVVWETPGEETAGVA